MTTQKRNLILIAVWVATVITVLPAIFHWAAPAPHTGLDRYFRIGIGYVVALAICWWIYQTEARKLSRRQAAIVVLFTGLLTLVVNNLHGFTVDHGVNYFGQVSNSQWQAEVQDLIVRLNPQNLPHSYRFLPNAFVRWLQLAHLDYEHARDAYRLLFGLLLFYSLYRYARLHTTYLGALLAMLMTAAVYPISFEFYAGQLTDPMSHLSFLLALIFLETGNFAFLLSTLLIGSLAKETVLAMTGYYILFCRSDRQYRQKAGALAILSILVYFGVRMAVLKGGMHYKEVSGVSLDHIWTNLADSRWPTVFMLTVGFFVPFTVLSWRETPISLQRQSLFLLTVLFISSVAFSWLAESRNYMPLAFVLAVISARYLCREASHADSSVDDLEQLKKSTP